MNEWFDYSLYPEEDAPQPPALLTEKADFIARLCAAWDFGILPSPTSLTRGC